MSDSGTSTGTIREDLSPVERDLIERALREYRDSMAAAIARRNESISLILDAHDAPDTAELVRESKDRGPFVAIEWTVASAPSPTSPLSEET